MRESYINYEEKFKKLKEMLIKQDILNEKEIDNLIDAYDVMDKMYDEDKKIYSAISGDINYVDSDMQMIISMVKRKNPLKLTEQEKDLLEEYKSILDYLW